MTVTIYQYPKCSTCRKAIKWLDENGVDYRAVHIVEKTPSKTKLKKLWKASGLPLAKFFNTSGGSYREGGWTQKRKDGVSDAEILEALAADGMLIKRPILDAGETVLVGFKADAYAALFG